VAARAEKVIIEVGSKSLAWVVVLKVSIDQGFPNEFLALVDNPRRADYARRHDLQEILAMAVCAVLCDMNTFEEIAFWAARKEAWLRSFLKLEGDIPSYDTFNRVFRILNPKSFESAFRRWVGGLVPAVGSGTLGSMAKRCAVRATARTGRSIWSAPSPPNAVWCQSSQLSTPS
jgi:hypothetical protein